MATTHLTDVTDQEALERVYRILNENRLDSYYKSEKEGTLGFFHEGKFGGYHHAMALIAALLERNPDKVLEEQ